MRLQRRNWRELSCVPEGLPHTVAWQLQEVMNKYITLSNLKLQYGERPSLAEEAFVRYNLKFLC